MATATVKIENPTAEQQELMDDAARILRIWTLLASPIDPDFLPRDLIDRRRTQKIQRRLVDEAAVRWAAIMTELVAAGAEKVAVFG